MDKLKDIWNQILEESNLKVSAEPESKNIFSKKILPFSKFEDALSSKLASDLKSDSYSEAFLSSKFSQVFSIKENLEAALKDINAVRERDPASQGYVLTLLFSKGFAALQAHRAAYFFLTANEEVFSFFLQSKSSEIYGVDIHPAARIGEGVMLDHATGIVIGETSVVENEVSIFQGVTLGGTGKETGDRHPKVRQGVLISSGAKILGNVEIGKGAKVAAGSVVLENVEPQTTVAGVPAKVVGKPSSDKPATDVDHTIEEN